MTCTPPSRPYWTACRLPRALAVAAALALVASSPPGVRTAVFAQAPAPTLETDQVAEPGAYTTGPLFAGVGGSRTPQEQDLCEPGARWLRLRFSQLVLRGNDSLTLSGAEGGVFTFKGRHWENRSFFSRAFPGSCVHLSASLADPESGFKIEALQVGTAALAASTVVVAGAADICGGSCGATSAVILGIGPTSVFTAGDNAYSAGTLSEYDTKYDPTWGRFKSITRPTPGNHEYETAGAAGYFDYFNGVGASTGLAGDRGKGYYSHDVGDWHLIALNSNLDVSTGSTQEKWLRADLAANTKPCTLAYWHHPRFSQGSHGSDTSMQPLWQALYDFKADVVVNGHDHDYQRFAPQTPSGTADPTGGIREFVVGTGGESHYSFTRSVANFEVGNTTDFGVLKLTLSSTGYSWNFLPIAGASFTDSGSGTCHKAGSAGPASDFHTVTPCRAFDTRELSGPTLGAPLTCGTEQRFALAGKCGVPASATAVSVNLTGTASTAQGNLRLYPAGVPTPLVSTLNYTAGLTRANNAVAALGTGGQISVLCSPSGTTHVVLDVNGYFQ